MSAPNIATLFDFETAYEDALANYFTNVNVGGFQFRQVLTPRTNLATANFKATPRLQIKAGILGLAASGSGTPEEIQPNTTDSYYSYYTIGVQIDVVTSRSNTSQPHGLYRGTTRQGMLAYATALNVAHPADLQTIFVSPQSSTQAVDPDNDEILTQLAYSIDFHIPPSSFP